MKNINNFISYLADIKHIQVTPLMQQSIEYCLEYFRYTKCIDFLNSKHFDEKLFLETISLSENKYNIDINKNYLKIFNTLSKYFIDYMDGEIDTKTVEISDENNLETKGEASDTVNANESLLLDNSFCPNDISRVCFNKIMDNIKIKANELSSIIGLKDKKENIIKNDVGIIIYDLIRSQYITNSNLSGDLVFDYHLFPSYFGDKSSMHLMSKDGFYKSNVYSSYNCIEKRYFETNIAAMLLSNVFSDIQAVHKSSSLKNICLIPDSIDEFNISFRRSIMTYNRDLFLIPQSVVFAIHIMYTFPLMKGSFAIVDLDTEEPTLFEFKIENSFIIRRGRRKIDFLTSPYSKLVKTYISEYGRKYGIAFSENDIIKITSLRLMDQIFYDKKTSIVFDCDNDDIVSLDYDEDLYKLVVDEISDIKKSFQKQFKEFSNSIFFISSLKTDPFTFGIHDVKEAFEHVLDCNRKKLPIWKEEMPTIEVEVLHNKKREYVQLVKPGITQDIIIGYDEDIIYDVQGVFYLRAFDDLKQVANHTDLPMRRNVIGALNTTKKATFMYSKPLNSDVEVKLFVKYNYNNENIFTLVGKSPTGEIFESTWEDQGRIKLESKVYAVVIKPTKDDSNRAQKAFIDIIDAVSHVVKNLDKEQVDFSRDYQIINNWNRAAHYHSTMSFRYSSLINNSILKKFLFDEEINLGGVKSSSRICFVLSSLQKIGNNMSNSSVKKIFYLLIEYIGKFSCIPIYAKESKYKEIQEYYAWYLNQLLKITDLKIRLGTVLMLSKEINNVGEDYFKVFDLIKNCVPKKGSEALYKAFTRNIAAYAWDSKTWLPTIYKLFDGTDLFIMCYRHIIESISKCNCDEICKHEKKQNGKPSLSKVRDQLECALAFINIRDENNLFFNPNEIDTEDFKTALSRLNNDIFDCFKKYSTRDYGPDKIFRSRLSLIMKNNGKTVETIYILNKALDGREVINLKYEDK